MNQIAERLAEARRRAGYPEASDAIARFGWTPSTYYGHENGSRGFKADKARKYAKAFGVSVEWLLYGEGGNTAPELAEAPPSPEGVDLVPVYDVQASAGHGAVIYDEEHVASLAFPPDYLRKLTRANPRDLKIITVKGDSMLPTLNDDDVVMLDTSKRDLSYDGLFVLRDNGDGLLVKRIGRASRSGYVTLISDNRDLYPAVERAIADIEVIGKVLWQGRKV